MPTQKPRITITLTSRQHDVLRSLSSSSGQSMSSLLCEVLDTAFPVFERMAVTFQHLKQARDAEKAKIAKTLDQAQEAFEPIAAAAVSQFDLFMARVDRAAGAAGSAPSRAGAPAARPKTPGTNRGVTTPPPNPPKPAARGRLAKVRQPHKVIQKKGA